MNPPLDPTLPTNGRQNGRTGLGSQRYLRLFECLTPLMGSHDPREIAWRSCELIASMLEV